MAIRFDILPEHEFFIGTDQPIEINVKQTDETTEQLMTGWSLTHEIMDDENGPVRVTKTVGSGITIQNGTATNDQAAIQIDDTDTEPLPPGVYYHRLRRTDAGYERILSYGVCHLLESGL